MTADTSLAPLTEEELRLPGELSLLDFFTWYPRVKGEAERAIIDSGVPKIRIFRPSTLVTDDIRFGWIDWMLFKIHYVLDPIIPSEWHSIHVRDVGHAMTIASEDALKGTTSDKDEEQQVTFLEYAHMTQLLESRKAPRHSE
eukprot:CAMPEP_0175829052 /NCGR_PEP_ID=MMETSP0107_2-20121207/13133_1 /TAXON_ID=195067 ORGANISM="Goniomonas pacifica, Strain CCMP1869" /NCGR_SAMPLE_ID=MMETSP0107_2 /ASSEMBLY_ACC=CAM_ASM_000203 /LENGTH=141 /DNA_ID=CAMNT_0017141813 /DNA_START=54 /DNA_END=476 /DNA_ORIENTATION=-